MWENLQLLVHRPKSTYFFQPPNNWVNCVRESILNLAANVSHDKLVSLGTCFGTFTDLQILVAHHNSDYLAPYAKYKVWVKPGAEQSFLFVPLE